MNRYKPFLPLASLNASESTICNITITEGDVYISLDPTKAMGLDEIWLY